MSWAEVKEALITGAEYFGCTFAIAYFGYQVAHPLGEGAILDFLVAPLRPAFGIASVTFAGAALNFLRKLSFNTEGK